MRSIDESLNKMNLDYIDMMIIHSPQPWEKVNQSNNRFFKENQEVWRAMEESVKSGKVKTIGVSNFLKEDIENILSTYSIKPVVNQILCHVSNTPLELIEYCKESDIAVEAYSPVGHGALLNNPIIKEMSKKYDVSIPQLCIRYDWQLGLIVLPKTANPEHIKNNASIDFVISDEGMDILKHLEKIKDYGKFGMFPVYGGKL